MGFIYNFVYKFDTMAKRKIAFFLTVATILCGVFLGFSSFKEDYSDSIKTSLMGVYRSDVEDHATGNHVSLFNYLFIYKEQEDFFSLAVCAVLVLAFLFKGKSAACAILEAKEQGPKDLQTVALVHVISSIIFFLYVNNDHSMEPFKFCFPALITFVLAFLAEKFWSVAFVEMKQQGLRLGIGSAKEELSRIFSGSGAQQISHNCPNCGNHLAANDGFCKGCGSKAPRPQQAGRFCPQCRAPLEAGARFCNQCGRNC